MNPTRSRKSQKWCAGAPSPGLVVWGLTVVRSSATRVSASVSVRGPGTRVSTPT